MSKNTGFDCRSPLRYTGTKALKTTGSTRFKTAAGTLLPTIQYAECACGRLSASSKPLLVWKGSKKRGVAGCGWG
ncbi:hypothetical protein D1157_13950 [Anaerotruncus sp. X29]|nr:hypothetical protein [Anaerotruncus sp. X29]